MEEPSLPEPRTMAQTLDQIVVKVEQWFFFVIVAALMGLGLVPIVLRYFGESGNTWTGPLSQQLVLWLALFGAIAATRDRKHICVDAISHFLPTPWRRGLRGLTELVAAGICAYLVTLAVDFVREEAEFVGDEVAFRLPLLGLDVLTAWLPTVIPIGFALLALRLLIAGVMDLVRAFKGEGI